MERNYPIVKITQEMIDTAKKFIPFTQVRRTIASEIDTLTGHLGEFVFAEYFYGNWHNHRVSKNRGETDFDDIEIKTSAFPFSDRLNLLVREDYAQIRKPSFYIQVIIDVSSRYARTIEPGTKAYICGFASAEEVDKAGKRDFGSKFRRAGGYQCYYICIKDLHPMDEFAGAYKSSHKEL